MQFLLLKFYIRKAYNRQNQISSIPFYTTIACKHILNMIVLSLFFNLYGNKLVVEMYILYASIKNVSRDYFDADYTHSTLQRGLYVHTKIAAESSNGTPQTHRSPQSEVRKGDTRARATHNNMQKKKKSKEEKDVCEASIPLS